MVPLKLALAVTAGAAEAFAAKLPGAAAPGMGPVGGTATGAVGAGAAACWPSACRFAGAFIMIMVPLNFEAGLSFSLKPHFWQLRTSSLFCAPQFVQNTTQTSTFTAGCRAGYVA
jgi:hypothetical protein